MTAKISIGFETVENIGAAIVFPQASPIFQIGEARPPAIMAATTMLHGAGLKKKKVSPSIIL